MALNMVKTILILAANPKGTTARRLDEEVREVQEALKLSRDRAGFRLEPRMAVRWKDVRRALEELQPEIVHFSGHGEEEKGLVLEEEDGSVRMVSTDALRRLFELFPCVKCVVLNACYSEVQARAIYQYVPCVIGMRLEIGDRAARDFAVAFYDGVGAGWDYGRAYKLGLSGMADDGAVSTPMLLREEAGAIVGLEPRAIALEEPGGKMSIESSFYVARSQAEETAVREILKSGGLVRIKGPHEFGKSSLMGRVIDRVLADGVKTVAINCREIDHESLGSLNVFLKYFCGQVTRKLRVENRLQDYWDSGLGSKGDCGEYFEDYLLPQISGALVLELDEVDVLFEGNGDRAWVVDFLSMLRAWFEKGRTSVQWKKFRLVLVHVTDIDQETLKQEQSPFNVGMEIRLEAFDAGQVVDLAWRHGLAEAIATQVMDLVGGHPQLVRLGLYAIASGQDMDEDWCTEAGPYGRHLVRVRSRLERDQQLLTAFRRVLGSEAGEGLDIRWSSALLSLGVGRLHQNKVRITCELYRRYFSSVLGV
jgi:hypothetical protein